MNLIWTKIDIRSTIHCWSVGAYGTNPGIVEIL